MKFLYESWSAFEDSFLSKKEKNGKLPASHRYDLIPLLRSRPGGFKGSWLCRTCRCKNTILLQL